MKLLKNRLQTVNINRARAVQVERRWNRRDRDRVLIRDNWVCVTCKKIGRITLAAEVDHIIPLELGGSDGDANKQSLCRACHTEKTAIERRNRDA
jgi:5-methylcytosine-specific restriction enzyme A